MNATRHTIFIAIYPTSIGLIAALLLLCMGCASTSEPYSEQDKAALITGAWKYETDGSNVLGKGIFFIERDGERFVGVIRDSRQGQLPVRIRLNRRMLTLNISDISIRGHIDDNEFTAFVDMNLWDVSISASARQRNRVKGILRAKRMNASYEPIVDLLGGCEKPLYEHDYTCQD